MGLYHSVKHDCSYLALAEFFGGNILALHMDVTPQNDCMTAVPKQMYFKNSLMENGYETLVPFLMLLLLNGENWSRLF